MQSTSRMTALQYGLLMTLSMLVLGAIGELLGWPIRASIGGAIAVGVGVGWRAYAQYGPGPMNRNRPT